MSGQKFFHYFDPWTDERSLLCKFVSFQLKVLFTKNPPSTAACPLDKVNTILKTVQNFLYLAFPCIRSTKKESKHISFHQSLKGYLCVHFGQKKLVKNILFLLHQHSLKRFDSNYTPFKLACQNSWRISPYQIPCYEGRVRVCNMQLDI